MDAPNIFEYLEVQPYLLDLYKFKKMTVPGFSYEVWITEIKLKSRGHLRDIVTGQVDLSESLIPFFINGLNLNSDEAEYFALLARYSGAASPTTKAIYGKSLIQIWKVNLHQIEIQNIETFLLDSIIPVVFTYLSFKDSNSDARKIAMALGIEVSRAQNALKCLIWQKLVDGQIDSKGIISYKVIQPYFKIPDQPGNEFLKNFHMEGLKLAMQSHDLPAQTRKFHSTFVALSPTQFVEAHKIMCDCNDRIMGMFDSENLENRSIYRLNFQLFPAVGRQSKDVIIDDTAHEVESSQF